MTLNIELTNAYALVIIEFASDNVCKGYKINSTGLSEAHLGIQDDVKHIIKCYEPFKMKYLNELSKNNGMKTDSTIIDLLDLFKIKYDDFTNKCNWDALSYEKIIRILKHWHADINFV